MITFDRVSKRYEEGHDALREVSVTIDPDELVFLTGHSGAGKSTMLRLIMLMERPTRGQVTVDGRNLAKIRRRGIPRHRRDIGVVFQNHRLLMDRTVYDNVALPLTIAGYDHRAVGRRVRAALDKVGLLDREHTMPVALSGGEQQRVGIARAVVNKPPLLLADEPTGNLDPASRETAMDYLSGFHAEGRTIVMVTHDDFAASYAKRTLRLVNGVVTEATAARAA